MSRDTAHKVRENRARRAATRQGLKAQKSPRRDPQAFDFDTWRLVNAETGAIVASGYAGGWYGLSLDALEAELAKGMSEAERRALRKGRTTR